MKVADLGAAQLRSRLRRGELILDIRPFAARVQSPIDSVAGGLARLYGDFRVLPPGSFADFHVALAPPSGGADKFLQMLRTELKSRVDTMLRTLPGPEGLDGFFAARLRKMY